MEKVFPLEGVGLPRSFPARGSGLTGRSRGGVVEKVLVPGRFLVALEGGGKLEVHGQVSLRPGQRVQVLFDEVGRTGKGSLEQDPVGIPREQFSQWTAWIPLGFGGKDAQAKLEVFLEKRPGKRTLKEAFAAYFVFTVSTKKQGLVQWSVHLKGRQVLLQVYAPDCDKEELTELVVGIERGLESKGFSLAGKALFLDRPFRVPTGARLNLRG